MHTASIISAQDLSLNRKNIPIIEKLSFAVPSGAQVAIVGPNGGGKSTLLEVLSIQGSELVQAGTIDRAFPPLETAYLPQRSTLQRDFPLLVQDVVSGGLCPRVGWLKSITGTHRHSVEDALITVGLPGFALQSIQALSGGQFQRVLFARLMVQQASIVFLDEPMTGVDEPTKIDLMKLINRWNQSGQTQLIVLHDLEIVRQFFTHVLLLARSFSHFGLTKDVLTPENLETAYSVAQTWEGAAQ